VSGKMQRSACLLEIGATQVEGLWQAPRWAGGAKRQAAAAFSSGEGAESGQALRTAIDSVLGSILPERMLTSPFVRIALGGPHIMPAVLPFVTLPRPAADRNLIIFQRFCREHRLEPQSVAVIGCPLGNGKSGNGKVLCLAVERNTLNDIKSALAGRGLHPDVIAPAYLLRCQESGRGALEGPAVALLEERGAVAILVWDEHGTIVHIAAMALSGKDAIGTGQRITARIRRYALVAGAEGASATVYIDGRIDGEIAAGLKRAGLKVLAWRAASAPGGPAS
jgi:hypothetical protein